MPTPEEINDPFCQQPRVYEIRKLPDFPPIFIEREPRIKVNPYAKFDKYHHKRKKK